MHFDIFAKWDVFLRLKWLNFLTELRCYNVGRGFHFRIQWVNTYLEQWAVPGVSYYDHLPVLFRYHIYYVIYKRWRTLQELQPQFRADHSWMSRGEEAREGTALASQSPSLEDPVPFSSPLSFNQDELHFFVCCSFVLTFTNTEQAPLGACLVSSLQNQVGQFRFKNQETWSSDPLSH